MEEKIDYVVVSSIADVDAPDSIWSSKELAEHYVKTTCKKYTGIRFGIFPVKVNEVSGFDWDNRL